MSERTTAKLAADLQRGDIGVNELREAAARLIELDAGIEACQEALEAQAVIGADLARAAFADLLPPGVTIEQLVATYTAVHNSATWVHHSRDEVEIILRSVKP